MNNKKQTLFHSGWRDRRMNEMFSPRLLVICGLALISSLSFWLAFGSSSRDQPSLALSEDPAPTPLAEEKAHFPPTPDLCPLGTNTPLNISSICATFPTHLLSSIQITIKTGIGERPHLETLLNTYASCIPNLLIVSDTPDSVAGHDVHDILADLPANYTNDPDWEAYLEQHRALEAGEKIQKNHGGWKLDRFKFLPMVEYAYAMNPDAEWFVFLETDVYMFWDTMFRMLERLDPEERHYLGAAAVGAYDRWFAYGGAGFVLSRGILKELPLTGDARLSKRYEALVRRECCGDAVLAYVLYDQLKARIGTMFPSFSGEEPQWAEVRREKWCVPLLSLHRVTAEQMESLWRWERCRAEDERAITFATFMDWSVGTILADGEGVKANWNNGAGDEELLMNGRGAATCFAACERSRTCLRASYEEEKCRFSEGVRLGEAVEREMESMWDVKKLKDLGLVAGGNDGEPYCSQTDWLEPDILLPPKDFWQVLHLKAWPPPIPEEELP